MLRLVPVALVLALPLAAVAQPTDRYAFPPGYQPPRPPMPTPAAAAPAFTPCIDYPNLPAVMGPCQGPVGGTIRVRLRQNLAAQPVLLSFKAVVSRAMPGRLQVRLQRLGNDYGLAAPPQLCMQGGGSWETELVLANGQNLGVIGGYTPTNCPR
jgi:hypothetical protein